MFIKVVPNQKGRPGTYFCYLVESYREEGKPKHRVIKNFGLLEDDQVPYLKAMYAKRSPVSFMMMTSTGRRRLEQRRQL